MPVNIFISNLCETTCEDHLRKLFSHFGEVLSVQVIMSHETGKSEKFAFVEMAGRDEGDAAIRQINNMQFMGRYLEAKEVRNKKDK